MLVTRVSGALDLITQAGVVTPVSGLPAGARPMDIKLDPGFAQNRRVFISFQEDDSAVPRIGRAKDEPGIIPSGLALMTATLSGAAGGEMSLTAVQVIWRQTKVCSFAGSGEYGGRIALSPDGQSLFLAAGDRQEFEPVQKLDNTLGKIIRLRLDGSVPADNPLISNAGARPEIWSVGHRNPYGLLFASDGRLMSTEMGPLGGDEFNIIAAGKNYGWPLASNGSHYSGDDIPDHVAGDGFEGPSASWSPVIAPAGMIQYSGLLFPMWRDDILVTGLASKALIRVRVTGASAFEVERIGMGQRIRDIEQSSDGALWIVEDGASARLLRLTPA